MSRALRVAVLALVAAALATPGFGCSSKSESQPNPEFKTPDIPAGRSGGDGPPGGAKQPKK